MIVVNEAHARRDTLGMNARSVSHIAKFAMLVVIKHNPASGADREIRKPVTVVVAGCAANSGLARHKARCLGHILEMSIA
jgi:hypothetical protein